MEKTLRTAATGLAAQQRFVEIIAHNLANVNTTGFKRVRPEFQDLLYETLRTLGTTAPSGIGDRPHEVQIGSGTELVATSRVLGQGDLQPTNNPLDLAINGDGFFVVRRPDGSLVYTRDGSFRIDREGRVVSSHGYILEPGIVVPEESAQLRVSRDGVFVAVAADGSGEQVLGQLLLARFVNPAGLRALGENLYAETPASGPPLVETPGQGSVGEILQAHLESSNVELVEEMVGLIMAQRAYELNAKAIRTADELLQAAVNLKS
ncbi:MAG: flagellar basal-body rod protein FlgG [Candidatus Kapabacteria bacterium]|nr:flagellar basal-body rod protein FlgG [Candidatus Kapabacteria bacterium]MDW7996758.1 flagellar basal-body rod protein FlgG [Bacteroidota bacterium]MDW8224533.1 flagellar basal-body rod protein FlgG [Bacteroidota bacterium]